MNIPYIAVILAILTTILALNLFRKLALRIDLVDFPGERKKHDGSIPLIGGLSMFAGILVSLLMLPIDKDLIKYLLLALFTLVAVGSFDDHKNISVWLRFLFQAIAALIMILIAGINVESIGNLNGSGVIILQQWSILFTFIAVIGSINAVNMMDGIHGLAGGQSLISFIAISFLAFINNSFLGFSIAILFCAVLMPFMIENLCIGRSEAKRVFMGDAGSMMLGLAIVWLLVDLSQGVNRSFAPVTALWIFSVPLIDFFFTILRRIAKKQSPLKPDRGHLHHVLIQKGFSELQSLLIILVLTLVIAIVGVLGEILIISEWKMFYGFIFIFLLYSLYISYSWKLLNSFSS